MTLYELTGQMMELKDMMEDTTIDQQTIKDTLEGVEMEIEEKADGYAKIMKSIEGDIDILDKEIKRLTDKKKTLKTNVESLKKNLENAMLAVDKRKFKTNLFSFGIQKNPPSVVIDDETKIPKDFLIEKEPELDRKSLKEWLKDHDVDFAHLVQTESLRIR